MAPNPIRAFALRVASLWQPDSEPASRPETPLWGAPYRSSNPDLDLAELAERLKERGAVWGDWGTPYRAGLHAVDALEPSTGLNRRGAMVWGYHGNLTMGDHGAFPLAVPFDPDPAQSPPPSPPPHEPLGVPEPRVALPAPTALRPLKLPEILRRRAAVAFGFEPIEDDADVFSPVEEAYGGIEEEPLLRSVRDRPPTPHKVARDRNPSEPFDARLQALVRQAVAASAPADPEPGPSLAENSGHPADDSDAGARHTRR